MQVKKSNEGVLDRVMTSKANKRKELEQKFGRTSGLHLEVLMRFMTDAQVAKLVEGYENNKSTPGAGLHTPSPVQFELYEEHLKFPGKIQDFAAIKKMDASSLRSILYRVAYWKHVVSTRAEV